MMFYPEECKTIIDFEYTPMEGSQRKRTINKLSKNMLNDDAVNAYMDMLNMKYGKDKNIRCLTTYFFASLMTRLGEDQKLTVKRKTKFFENLLHNNKTLPRRTIIPLHTDEDHWTLFCICFDTHHIITMNSFDDRNDVIKGYKGGYGAYIDKTFKALIDLMYFAETPVQFNHIFKSNSPWVMVRAFQIKCQTDGFSCGFFVNYCAKICCETDQVGEIIGYNIPDHAAMRKTVVEEFVDSQLQLGDYDVVEIPGMEYTHDFHTVKKIRKSTPFVQLSCVMEPHKISAFKPRCVNNNTLCKSTLGEFVDALSGVPVGGHFTMLIDGGFTVGQRGEILDTACLAFAVVHAAKKQLLAKKLHRLTVLVTSDEIYKVMVENNIVVASHEAYDSNDIAFEDEEDAKSMFIMGMQEIFAGFFHAFCRLATSFKVYCFKKNELAEAYTPETHFFGFHV